MLHVLRMSHLNPVWIMYWLTSVLWLPKFAVRAMYMIVCSSGRGPLV